MMRGDNTHEKNDPRKKLLVNTNVIKVVSVHQFNHGRTDNNQIYIFNF